MLDSELNIQEDIEDQYFNQAFSINYKCTCLKLHLPIKALDATASFTRSTTKLSCNDRKNQA